MKYVKPFLNTYRQFIIIYFTSYYRLPHLNKTIGKTKCSKLAVILFERVNWASPDSTWIAFLYPLEWGLLQEYTWSSCGDVFRKCEIFLN